MFWNTSIQLTGISIESSQASRFLSFFSLLYFSFVVEICFVPYFPFQWSLRIGCFYEQWLSPLIIYSEFSSSFLSFAEIFLHFVGLFLWNSRSISSKARFDSISYENNFISYQNGLFAYPSTVCVGYWKT